MLFKSKHSSFAIVNRNINLRKLILQMEMSFLNVGKNLSVIFNSSVYKVFIIGLISKLLLRNIEKNITVIYSI